METLTHQPMEEGPLVEETWLSAGLDMYKLTMSQFLYEQLADKQVTFTLHNRGEQRLADYVDPTDLKDRLEFIRQRGWSPDEIAYFRELKNANGEQRFSDEFLTYLVSNDLPEVNVRLDETTDDLAVDVTGDAPLVTFWETVVMSEVSEQYFANFNRAHGINVYDLYAENDRRLDAKIDYLHEHPDVKVVEFGGRRRHSLRLQKHNLHRLLAETPANTIGTSNVALSHFEATALKGTFAHELPMIAAGLAKIAGQSVRESQSQLFEAWSQRYPDLTSMLSDTFGSDFTFSQITAEQATRWGGLRQDSGDPLAFGEKAIKLYQGYGIDPTTKTVLFSDSLSLSPEKNTVESIRARFSGRLGFLFGIGTNLSNDTGQKPLNFVMKATHVYDPVLGRGVVTVKLSDDAGKHTGPADEVAFYKEEFTMNNQICHEIAFTR